MNHIDNRLENKTHLVNEGVVFLPTSEEWTEILENHIYLGRRVGALGHEDWIKYRLDLSRKYREIQLGLYYHGLEELYGLMPIAILRVEGELQRVHIERLTCDECGWLGETANPMLSDLYDPESWVDQTRRAEKFPVRSCPRCGKKLPRHPIWIEPYEGG